MCADPAMAKIPWRSCRPWHRNFAVKICVVGDLVRGPCMAFRVRPVRALPGRDEASPRRFGMCLHFFHIHDQGVYQSCLGSEFWGRAVEFGDLH